MDSLRSVAVELKLQVPGRKGRTLAESHDIDVLAVLPRTFAS